MIKRGRDVLFAERRGRGNFVRKINKSLREGYGWKRDAFFDRCICFRYFYDKRH